MCAWGKTCVHCVSAWQCNESCRNGQVYPVGNSVLSVFSNQTPIFCCLRNGSLKPNWGRSVVSRRPTRWPPMDISGYLEGYFFKREFWFCLYVSNSFYHLPAFGFISLPPPFIPSFLLDYKTHGYPSQFTILESVQGSMMLHFQYNIQQKTCSILPGVF